MRVSNRVLGGSFILAAALASPAAHATAYLTRDFTVSIWNMATVGLSSAYQNALPTNPMVTTAGANLVNGATLRTALNFVDNTGTATIAHFFATGGVTSSPFSDLSQTISSGGFASATLMEFTFTINNAIAGIIFHDDGISLFRHGTTTQNLVAAGAAGPTSEVGTPYSIGPGTYDLWYMAANGLPEDLQMTVPEPLSMAAFGAGLLGLGGLRLRRRANA